MFNLITEYILISMQNISNKPCQCESTDYTGRMIHSGTNSPPAEGSTQ
jgi:hypothetical protein